MAGLSDNNLAESSNTGSFGLADDHDEGGKLEDAKHALAESKANKTDFTKLKSILDVPLKVSVSVGQTKMLASEIIELKAGFVLELDKLAGEAMEIMINDKLVALGEVVVVNEKYGVRLTDVISNHHSMPGSDSNS
jgi:flagellar motor switch protein FliN/FliY